jgi:dipeptidyl aminopeptidase/acylaminoacyl peptidase
MSQTGDGDPQDLLAPPHSHQSRVHEYGGCAYTVHGDHLYFVNARDQRIYALKMAAQPPHGGDQTPYPITPAGPWRFADLMVDPHHRRLIAVGECAREDDEAENSLLTIALGDELNGAIECSDVVTPLVGGADFYAYPRLSPDGKILCWLEWHHPQMPWDGTELWLATLDSEGLPVDRRRVAGGTDEAIMQPEWSPNGELFYLSDRSDWWNIYRLDANKNPQNSANAAPLIAMSAEFAAPLWQFGARYFDFIDGDTIGCLWTASGVWQAAKIHIPTAQLDSFDTPYTRFHGACCHHGQLVCVAANALLGDRVISLSATADAKYKSPSIEQCVYCPPGAPDVLSLQNHASIKQTALTAADLSSPQSLMFTSADGSQVQGFFYPPTHADCTVPKGEQPPLIVICHGGPTGAGSSALNLKIQYWSSRGFAVFDLNYRGSSGFGRKFRQALHQRWGVADVEDTGYAVRHLAAEGLIDPQRCVIRGSSAGGYTVLAALTFSDTFKAGASFYGIGDLEILATDTHKFESRYLDNLVGPYPETRERYLERSPIHHADQLDCPVIFFQGLKDRVVPPNQAQLMADALRQKGIHVQHITFAEEGHGFRQATNIIAALEAELAFYTEVFDLASAI